MKKRGKLPQRGRRRSPGGRLLSMFLALCMVLTMLPVSAIAEEAQTTIGASGEIIAFEPLAETEKTVTTGTSIKDLELPETLTATVRANPDFGMLADTNQQTVTDRVYDYEYEEILVDIPVTWTSLPEYDMDSEGEYVFTPVIEGYRVSAELPQVTVTVEAARLMRGLVSPMVVDEVAQIGSTLYLTLQAAFDVVEEGQTIKLLKDITLTATATIASGNDKNFTLDLNGKTLNIGDYIAIEHKGSGTLTIKDTASGGKITSRKGAGGTVSLEGGSLVVASGTVENTFAAGSGIFNIGAGNVSIQGGILSAGHIVIYNRGTGNVSVSGGVIGLPTSGITAIYNELSGKVTISGGALSSINVVYNNSTGEVSVSGGTLSASGDGSYAIYNSGSGKVRVSGGTISTTGTDSMGIYNRYGIVSISSGSPVIQGEGQAMNKAPDFSSYANVKVTASTSYDGSSPVASYDPSNIANYKYLKFEPAPNVAQIGSTGYETLQEAVNAVAEGQTIQLLDDITLTATVTITSGSNKSFTLDLKGKTLDGGSKTAISHEGRGTLTITDTSGGELGTIMSSYWKDGTINLINNGTLVVAGGTVKQTGNGLGAIYSKSTGSVSVTSGTVEGTGKANGIYSSSTGSVSVTGGTVKNTNSSDAYADAISNNGTGMVSVSGGKVISGSGRAILNFNAGSVSVSGGTVSADASPAILEGGLGKITIGGTATVTSANSSATYPGTIYLDLGGSPALEITGGTIENTAAGGNAIYNEFTRKISIPSGTPVIKGDGKAMNKAPDLSSYANVKVTASTFYNGASPVTYNAANIATYKYLKFEQGSANVAQIGSTGYSTLQDAVAAVTKGQTIQLLDNINLGATVTIASGNSTNFTLDLNGKTLNGDSNIAILHEGSGTLTITDTSGGEGGTIMGSNWYGTINLINDSSLVVAGGTVKCTGQGIGVIYSQSTGSVSVTGGTVESTDIRAGIYNSSTGSVSITGGTVKNTNSLSANANAISNNGTGMVSVSGGTVISGLCRAISNYGAGSVSVSGGTVSADGSPAISTVKRGKITIGGTAMVTSANSSATLLGTIYLDSGDNSDTALEITGGTIENTAPNGYAIYNASARKTSISSGTPIIKGRGMVMNKAPDLSSYANVKVTASTNYDGSLPDTYDPPNIATYKYLKFEQGSAKVAQIGSTGYETLQEAVNAVAEGQTIQLLDDITLTATVTITSGSNKSFTLDLKGKTLDGGANTAIKHEGTGTLTITDTKGGGKVTAKKDKYSCTIDLNGGSLVVVGGTLENTDAGSAIYNEGAGTVNIQGGTVRGYYYAIQNKSTGDVIVFDGVLEGQIAIYNYSRSGNVTISGGALSGTMRGIYNSSTGEVSVSGGTVSASGDNSQAIQNVGNGNVSVSGGTLKASGDKSRAISNGSMVNVSISGGTVSATGTNSVGIDSGTIYIPSGSPVIQGGGRAMNTAPDLSGYTKVKVTASTNYDGTLSVAYDSEKIDTYKYLTFTNDTDNTVTNLNLGGKLIAPETGGTPMTTITDDDQYTGTVEWDGSPTKFLADTVYFATVTLTAKPGYTFSGVAQRAFTCTGATYVMNPAGYGDMLNVTITFPKTAASALQSIAITTPPNTTAYKFGDAFSIAGMVVKATYNDGTEDANFTAYTVDKTGALTMGDTTITLTANGTSITTTQAITVTKADGPAAPTGLAGVAPTSAGGTDGKITGTSTAMEYAKNLGFTGAADCTATETTGLSAGTYYVRVKATATHEASASATVTVPAGVTKIAVPTANTGLKWTGTEQIGVNSGTGYTLSGTDKATDVGDYIATATLQSGYAWNDNTNTDKTISWSIAKADGPAVSGVSAVNCTTVSNNDGKLTGVTTAMEYKKSDAASYIPGTDSDITGLTNGTYLVRVKATATHNEGADSSFTVGAYVPSALTGTAAISNTTPRIGSVLTGSLDDGNNTGTLTYVWKADGAEVGTGASYTVTVADLGKAITLEIRSSIETGTVTSAATAAVLKKAASSAPGMPTLASKTHNTVTLTANVAYEFSKDGMAWQPSNVFGDLTTSTTYTFYQRVAETADTEASAASTGFSVTTDTAPADALTGTATISGTLKYGQTLTVAYSSGNNTGNLSYQWKRGSTNIGTNSNTYTIVEADINQTLTCEVTSDVQTGSVSGSTTATISKADGPAVTDVSAVNCTTVSNNDGKLTGVTTAMEYKKSGAASYTPGTGSDITGLTSGTYLVRVKATTTHNEGADSSFTVGAYVPGALTGTAAISNTAPRIGSVLNGSLVNGNNTGTLTYVWKADGTEVGTGASYTVTVADLGKAITLEIRSSVETGTITSAATAAVLKKAASYAPGAPTLVSKTHNTVTLTANAAYEFSKDGTTWQTGNVFSGLTASTAYTFYQRIASTFDTEASAASTGLGVTTNPNGGGGGGGSSSDNNSSPVIVTPPAPDKPNSPTQGEIKVPGTMDSKGNATVNISDKTVTDAFDKALADAKKNGNEQNGITVVLRVDTGSKTGSNITVNLPKTVQDTIIAKKIVNTIVVVDNPDIRIGMDLTTVEEINQQAKTDVNITATRTDRGKLTGDAKKAIGSRPVFDLKVNYGSGKQVQSFGAGSVSVTIPYTLGANEKAGNVQAVYVDGNGKVHWLTSSVYDSVNKVLRFSTNHFSTYGIGYKQTNTAFTDIASHWAKEDIEFVVSRGLFSGTSSTTFSPNTAMTRGMFVTAMGRLAKADVSSYKQSSFTDIRTDAYYMGYIEWASKNSIVNGTGNGKFAPDQSITREQMAVIMQNYAKVIGFTLPKVHAENTFADSVKISAYAKDAVKQMQMAGVISGKNGNLFDPQGTTTRAEVSAVLRRFVELSDLQRHHAGLDNE